MKRAAGMLAWAVVALVGASCDTDVVALERVSQEPSDASLPLDGGDAGADAAVRSGQILGSGFEAWADFEVHGHIGPLSGAKASAVIQPDGTFVLVFPEVRVLFDSAVIDIYIDVNEDGTCRSADDVVRSTELMLLGVPDDFRIELTPQDLGPSTFGCAPFA